MTKLQNIIYVWSKLLDRYASNGIVVIDMDGRVLVSSNPLAIDVVCGISGFAIFFFSHQLANGNRLA